MQGFIEFIREQGVVGLAIGFILGASVKDVVTSIVDDIVNPVIGLLLGGTEALAQQTISIGSAEIAWGNFVTTLLDFVIIAAIIYFVFKGLGLDKLDAQKE